MKLQEQLSNLEDDSEESVVIKNKLKSAENLSASVTYFLKTFDTTTFQTKVMVHAKPLLETSAE